MRKHVTPADPAATILDPVRGLPLPSDGAPVDWSPYWAGLQARGDVTVREVDAAPASAMPAKQKS